MNCQSDKEELVVSKSRRDWQEFSKGDPFRYMLTEVSYNERYDIRYEKTFIPRDSMKIEKMTNIIRPYTEYESVKLLEQYGFICEVFHFYEKDCFG